MTDEEMRLSLAVGPLLSPMLRRVVSIVLARAEWPVDRLDEALLVCDALSAHAPAHASDGRLTFGIRVSALEAELHVLDLTDEGAAQLLSDATLPVVGNVLERVADRVSVEQGQPGEGSRLLLVLKVPDGERVASPS